MSSLVIIVAVICLWIQVFVAFAADGCGSYCNDCLQIVNVLGFLGICCCFMQRQPATSCLLDLHDVVASPTVLHYCILLV